MEPTVYTVQSASIIQWRISGHSRRTEWIRGAWNNMKEIGIVGDPDDILQRT